MIKDERLTSFYIRLTSRQREILQLASDGMTNTEIARQLYIAPSVVAGHLTNIYAELGTLDELVGIRLNRYTLIRVFAGFFERNPQLIAVHASSSD